MAVKKPEKKKRKKVILITIFVLVVLSFVIALIADVSLDKKSFGNQIALIPIEGAITTSGNGLLPFDENGASSSIITKNIKKANENSNVKAVILEINSPGGTVVASEEIANEIKKLDKPVVAFIREIGTSGAYWVASSADIIVADPFSITGSIGVISSYLEFSDLLENYGVKYESLTSGEFKDTGSPFKKLSSKERALLQNVLDTIHDSFVNEVAVNRNLDKKEVEKLATGFFYLGKEAKELGLVDYLGDKDLAINKSKELAGIEEATLVRYEERKKIFSILDLVSTKTAYYLGRGIGDSLTGNVNADVEEIKPVLY